MIDEDGVRRREVNVAGRSPGGHYSAAVIAGDLVFLAGQTPRDADRKVIGETIEEQTQATLDNLEGALSAAGGSLKDLVKVTVYLTDLGLFSRFNAVYASRLDGAQPARTTVGCGLQGVMVEIDGIAHIGGRHADLQQDRGLTAWPFRTPLGT